MPKTITIYVSRNGNSFNLKLEDKDKHDSDNDITVDPGDTIIWMLNPAGSGLTALNGVLKLDPFDPKFDKNAHSLMESVCNKSGVYTGAVVTINPGKGKFEKYKIGFMVPGDGTIYWDDPKIQMN